MVREPGDPGPDFDTPLISTRGTTGDNIAFMDAVTHPPAPVNEPNLTYAPGSAERKELESEIDRLERKQHDLKAHIGGRRRSGGGAEIKVVQPHDHQHVLGVLKNSTQADAKAAVGRGREGRARVACPGLRRPRRGHPEGGRPAGRPVAAADQRGDRAGPVQDGLPGRDRQRLRADRLLALQRALRAADPGRAADPRTAPASGTAPTTARSRASSTRSRRSTSPRSPATCRPRPR